MSRWFKDWTAITEYVDRNPHSEIFYQVDYASINGPRLKVRVDALRFDHTFEGLRLELDKALEFLKEKDGKMVSLQREYDSFFL